MTDWVTPKPQETGTIISRALWQDLVDATNWLYETIILSETDEG